MSFTERLDQYDWIVINISGGKDSQAMLDYLAFLARAYAVSRRVVAVHCDLGRAEWRGTRELAEQHAAAYGYRFEVVARDRDLLHQVEHERGKWPDAARRYCTSDHKTSQVAKLHTRLAREVHRAEGKVRPVRILDCLGLRADESDRRAKRLADTLDDNGDAYELSVRASRNLRVDRWFPIHDWTTEMVWSQIDRAPTEPHEAYGLGMTRLSCVFCVLASESDLRIAARHNPDLLDEYLRIERTIGHTFRAGKSLAQIVKRRKGRVHLRVAA